MSNESETDRKRSPASAGDDAEEGDQGAGEKIVAPPTKKSKESEEVVILDDYDDNDDDNESGVVYVISSGEEEECSDVSEGGDEEEEEEDAVELDILTAVLAEVKEITSGKYRLVVESGPTVNLVVTQELKDAVLDITSGQKDEGFIPIVYVTDYQSTTEEDEEDINVYVTSFGAPKDDQVCSFCAEGVGDSTNGTIASNDYIVVKFKDKAEIFAFREDQLLLN